MTTTTDEYPTPRLEKSLAEPAPWDEPRGTAKVAAALAAFQADVPVVSKGNKAEVPTKAGGKYTYTYANLADISAVALPLLAKHGLAFTCRPRMIERGYVLEGQLLHSSGESIDGVLPLVSGTPQEMGSSMTYMRRYMLGCLTGLVTDDDDDGALANQAARRQQEPAGPTPAQRAQAQEYADRAAGKSTDPEALQKIYADVEKAGLLQAEITGAIGDVKAVGHLGPYLSHLKSLALKAEADARLARAQQDTDATADQDVPPPAQCGSKRRLDGAQCERNEHHEGAHAYPPPKLIGDPAKDDAPQGDDGTGY